MHPHEELIESFYTSFQKLDAEAMVRCYHADIRFSDPVFPVLSKTEVGAMWKMLCSQAKNFDLTFDSIEATNSQDGKKAFEMCKKLESEFAKRLGCGN